MSEPRPRRRFTQAMRLKSPAEFKRAYDRKRSAASPMLVVYVVERDAANPTTGPRLGTSVSKKVGNAVERNRVKRLFREAFRLAQFDLPGVDLVMIPRPPVTASAEELAHQLADLAHTAAKRLGRG